LQRYTERALQVEDTDWFLDRLYAFAGELGASLLVPRHSRYVIDLNRPPTTSPCTPGRTTPSSARRATSPARRSTATGQAPDEAEIQQRVSPYWQPYHHALADEVARLRAQHGHAVLFDAHSIKSELPWLFEGTLPHMNLGTVAAPAARRPAHTHWPGAGGQEDYSHVVDGRFKGGHITRHYGRPAPACTRAAGDVLARLHGRSPPYTWHAARGAR
jgi:N-formylglutamate deformylase